MYLKSVFEEGMRCLGSLRDTNDFNLFMGEDFLIILPRKKEKFLDKVSLNGFALIGSLGATSAEKGQMFIQTTFEDIFNEILYKKEI